MKLSLSKSVQLEGNYMNHSICATVITRLDEDGFEGRHIIQLSSHKSKSTIKQYSTKCPESKHKAMFDSLSNALMPSAKKFKSATVSKPTNQDIDKQDKDLTVQDVKENLPSFNIEPIDDFDTIDDTLLANLVYDESLVPTNEPVTNTNINNNNTVALTPQNPPVSTHTINTQFNTINQQAFPRLPQMYFPNSSVTINNNYNFKWTFTTKLVVRTVNAETANYKKHPKANILFTFKEKVFYYYIISIYIYPKTINFCWKQCIINSCCSVTWYSNKKLENSEICLNS